MKYVWIIVISVLTFLAITSGITKVILMKQDVDFFGKYGFSDPILMFYGAVQLIGGILLPFKKTRLIGAVVIAITFAISLVVLLLEGNIPVSIVTAQRLRRMAGIGCILTKNSREFF